MSNKRPLVLNTDGSQELLQSADSIDVGGYTLPNVAGNEGDFLVMGASNAEWASKVISTATDLYVSTAGNDTTGDGSSGTPWATVDKALSYLSGFILLAEVNINIVKGDYSATTTTLTINHPNGDKINIKGAYYNDTAVFSSVSGGPGNYSYTLTTANTEQYTYLDYVLVYNSAAVTSSEFRAFGVLQVVGINPGVYVILKSIATGAASAGTFYISIPQVKWTRMVSINSSIGSIQGIHDLYNMSSTYAEYIGVSQGVSYFLDCIFMNTNAAQRGWCRNSNGSGVTLTRIGIRNTESGWFTGSGATGSTNNCVCTSCYYGFRAYGGSSIALVYSSALNCTYGLYAQNGSIIFLGGGAVYLYSNSTNASPANNNVGNSNSYITY